MLSELDVSQQFSRSIVRDPAPEWDGRALLIATACDAGYLEHAFALIRSLDAMSPGFDFLLHLINVKHDVIERAVEFGKHLKSTRLHVSAELVTLPDPEQARAYYASARFIRLAEVLQATATTPVYVVDTDSLFVGPIDLDFTDKHQADVCLSTRGLLDSAKPLHLRVLAGAVLLRPTAAAREFLAAVSADLVDAFSRREAAWFIDQELLAKHVVARTGGVVAVNIKKKYIDWDFQQDAVLWTGKGRRKQLDLDYLLLRACFDSDLDRSQNARRLWSETRRLLPPGDGVLARSFDAVERSHQPRMAIYLPRLDLPWKRSGMPADGPPPVSPDVVELRLWWKRFAMSLAHHLTRRGAHVSLVEIPAWEITPERVDEGEYDFAFIPHRCHLDFERRHTPVMFYMQEYFRPVFVADEKGWSAASSVYPVQSDALPPAVLGAWDDYRARLAKQTLDSKFGQNPGCSLDLLRGRGDVPGRGYAFFPLQIPHDQSIRYFSDVEQLDALDAVVAWSEQVGIPLVVKPHPANRKSSMEYRQRFGNRVWWSEAHVHDLIQHSIGVITVNSGVGFEALLFGKPIVAFGRAEYDAVVQAATPSTFAGAWQAAVDEKSDERLVRYARFVDWFLARHAVDLSRPHAAWYSIDRIAARAFTLMEAKPE